jgi:phenylalanyl-tRNA synthetase beta chain
MQATVSGKKSGSLTKPLDPAFFPGRAATIYYRAPGTSATTKKGALGTLKAALSRSTVHDMEIGTLGILHPSVLQKFEISYPCSALEFTLEPFTKEMHNVFGAGGSQTIGKAAH